MSPELGALKARLKSGEQAVGYWFKTMSPMAAEVMADAGYDVCMIDLEHGPGDYWTALQVLQAMRGSGCTPMVRVPSLNRVEIKKALDIGVQGIMAPSVNNVADAQEAVAACRYAPRGVRGMAATIVRATNYGRDWREYVKVADDAIFVICQIETREGLDNVEAIAATEGVDLLFIGPMDLSASLGHLGEPDHPEVRAAIEKVEAAAKKAGKLLGTIPTPERSAAALFASGYAMVIGDSDVGLLRDGARRSLTALKG